MLIGTLLDESDHAIAAISQLLTYFIGGLNVFLLHCLEGINPVTRRLVFLAREFRRLVLRGDGETRYLDLNLKLTRRGVRASLEGEQVKIC